MKLHFKAIYTNTDGARVGAYGQHLATWEVPLLDPEKGNFAVKSRNCH